MIVIAKPALKSDEDLLLGTICKGDPRFAPHLATWQLAYDRYWRARGNPFALKKTIFTPCINKEQMALYKTKGRNKPYKDVRELELPCCPMCGSPGTGDLDHYLPEGVFGEFAVLKINLVPCCGHCNSGGKRTTYKGSAWPERFLHPYFDRYGAKPLWRVIVPNPAIPEYIAEPMPNLGPRLRKLMQFHLSHLLKWQFQSQMRTFWRALPTLVGNRLPVGPSTPAAVQAVLRDLQPNYEIPEGLNGWKAALLRGLDGNLPAHNYLLHAAINPPPRV